MMIDFVTGLPQSTQGSDTVWVVVDRLTKATHFIPLRVGKTTKTLSRKYMKVCFFLFILVYLDPTLYTLFMFSLNFIDVKLVAEDREAVRDTREHSL